ncbi:hypothetical protein SO694_00018058 [Aureococcus anophagefferens]|uniref:Rieske domain-containing protein n=1 Tax=Aureococcus anophagefferens TaxID=44056 RepID=A0ABR1G0C4_AURAN
MLGSAAALVPTLPMTSRRAAKTELNMVFGKTRASQKSYVPAVGQDQLKPGEAPASDRSAAIRSRKHCPPAAKPPRSRRPFLGSAVSSICAGLDICIAVDTDGSVYALGNKSPVLGTPMAAGSVANGLIRDPLTGSSFDVKTGELTGGGAVSVEVDVNAKTNFESGYWKGILDAQGKTDGGYY